MGAAGTERGGVVARFGNGKIFVAIARWRRGRGVDGDGVRGISVGIGEREREGTLGR